MIGIIISVLIFISFIIIAQLFVPMEYSWRTNTVSELAAQRYKYRLIMQTGFICFGVALTISSIFAVMNEELSLIKSIPVIVYGLSVGMSGIFCTSPFLKELEFSVKDAKMHSLFAQIAGFAFTLAILVSFFETMDIGIKLIHTATIVFVMGCSLLFAKVPSYRGLFQRIMYFGSFLWIIFMYSRNL